eukprot:m.71382 g.71382  ORF g.71382 m.71382 type:complete len:578 (+) comp50181_c0_seq4:126-1859(+)
MPLTRVVVEAIVAIEATSSREGVHLSAIHAYLGPGYTLNSITIALKKCQTDGLVVQRHGLFSLVRRLGMTPAEASPTFKEPKALATRGINLFIFHRDYRLVDNTALLKAPRPFVPAFIFTPQQSDIHVSAYCSSAALQFMCESLLELNQELNSLGTRLHVFRGDNLDILNQLHKRVGILSITHNRDYNKFAVERDAAIRAWCQSQNPPIRLYEEEDYDLVKSTQLLQPDGSPYRQLSAYFTRFIKEIPTPRPSPEILTPAAFHTLSDYKHEFWVDQWKTLYKENTRLAQRGGRHQALEALQKLLSPLKQGSASNLSAHLRFGTVSQREVFWSVLDTYRSPITPIIRELVLKSYYVKICCARPGLQRGESFRSDIDARIPWLTHDHEEYASLWASWCKGHTGFPLADAGMRELMATGFMDGRARMAAAAVLTRYFLINWREGARFFARHLVDYDPCSNNMGWQFSSGLDENADRVYKPPLNPFAESKISDPNAEYIKFWIPELSPFSARDIHEGLWDPSVYPIPSPPQEESSARSLIIWKTAASACASSDDTQSGTRSSSDASTSSQDEEHESSEERA